MEPDKLDEDTIDPRATVNRRMGYYMKKMSSMSFKSNS